MRPEAEDNLGTSTRSMPFPNRLYIAPLLLGLLIIQLNLQWMRVYQTTNAPTADSLVYMTQAYKDYWTFRSEGMIPLLKKGTAGNLQTSPLLWWLGGLSFLFFGLDPCNAYLVIGLAYLFWAAGVMYLAWQCKQHKLFVLLCGLLTLFLPSTVRPGFGIRSFLIDFPVSAPFIWATAFLLKSDLFRNRKFAAGYGLLVGVTILLRTTTFLYFLAHLVILVVICLNKRVWPHLWNAFLSGLIAFLVSGWFLLPNLPRIISYYTYWSKEAQKIQEATSFGSNLFHYLILFPNFHLSWWVFCAYGCFSLIALLFFLRKMVFHRKCIQELCITPAILISLVAVPTLILSFYSSRTVSVDYPFLAGYWILPLWMWVECVPDRRLFQYPIFLLLACFAIQHSHHLFRSPWKGAEAVDFKERLVLQTILEDAEKRGLPSVEVGNLNIHQHNSLSYHYWILANYFPEWRGRFTTTSLGRAESAKQLAEMNRFSDYVITILDYPENTHPNNRLAPEAKEILKGWGMQSLHRPIRLPDRTSVEVLMNPAKVYLVVPPPLGDGWYEDQVSFQVLNPARQEVILNLQLELFPLQNKPQPATVRLQSENKELYEYTFNTDFRVSEKVILPGTLFEKETMLTFRLSSSWAYTPDTTSLEKRRLAFRNLSITRN